MTVPHVPEQPDDNWLVVVPAHPGFGPGELVLEARRLSQGVVLPVFSSVRLLIDSLGQAQPWAIMPLGKAADLAGTEGVERIVFDPALSADAWQWEPSEAEGVVWGTIETGGKR